jgi:hypothetical protein
METPRRDCHPLGPANRYPVVDSLEVFQGNPASGAFGLGNDLLADAVVNVSGKALFFATALCKQAFRGPGVFPLQPRPQSAVAMTQRKDVCAAVAVPVTVRRDVDNPQIDAEHVEDCPLGRLGVVDRGEEIPLPIAENEVALSLPGGEEFALLLPAGKGDAFTSLERPDGDAIRIPAQNPVVVGDRTVSAEHADRLAVQFVDVCDLGNQANNNLRRQVELRLNRVVDQLLKCILAEGLRLPRAPTDGIGRFVGAFQRGEESLRLIWGGLEFHRDRQFHGPILAESGANVKYGKQALAYHLIAALVLLAAGIGATLGLAAFNARPHF